MNPQPPSYAAIEQARAENRERLGMLGLGCGPAGPCPGGPCPQGGMAGLGLAENATGVWFIAILGLVGMGVLWAATR